MYIKSNALIVFAVVFCLLSGCTSPKNTGAEVPTVTESAVSEANSSTATPAETSEEISAVPTVTESQTAIGTAIPAERDTEKSQEKDEQNTGNHQPADSTGITNSTDPTESTVSRADGLLDVEDGAGWG